MAVETSKKNENKKRREAQQREEALEKKRLQEEKARKKAIHDEIIIIITLLICIVFYLSYFGLCSIVGKGINVVTFGLLGGYLPYLFPIGLFFLVAFMRSNPDNPMATKKSTFFVCAIFIVAAIIHTISGAAKEYGFFKAFSVGYKDKIGGGLFGACLSKPMMYLFGEIATLIILFTLLVVCFILITGKAILASLRKNKQDPHEFYEDYADYTEEKPAVRQAKVPEYSQMTLDQIQEQNRKRQIKLVDAAPPVTTPDTSFYTKPAPVKAKKKSFIERLKDASKDEPEISSPSGPEMKEIASQGTTKAPVVDYRSELERKFGSSSETSAIPEITITKEHSYEDDYLSGKEVETELPPEPAPSFTSEPVPDDVPHYDSQTGEILPRRKVESTKTNALAQSEKKPATSEAVDETLSLDSSCVPQKAYCFPPLSLLSKPKNASKGMSNQELKETAAKLQNTLRSFGVNVTVTNISCGPSVTRYELQPEQGVKVSRITGLADDIKLNLAAADIRIEAPIPGKAAVGIEVPNSENSMVMLRSLLESPEFQDSKAKIAFAVGKDIGGNTIVTDIAKMPHLLIAGATGSGKSVCINTLIMSILFKYDPKDVRLIMVDPKVVELSVYNGIPHLLIPVVTDPKKASAALNWAVMEMTDRYKKFAELGVRDLSGYNSHVAASKVPLMNAAGMEYHVLPQVVIIIDELADLMMVAPGEVEDAICRLAQLARAAGIHLVIATQRPSVNVITGLIKANVPSRIAFSVSSSIDSRTILDQGGAEKLLGKGDMLFFPTGIPKPSRVQGAFISDTDVSAIVDFIKDKNSEASYNEEVSNQIANGVGSLDGASGKSSNENERDEYFIEAGKFIIDKDKASIGLLQRVYKIGFNRAARIMDQLADAGVVGPEEGTKPRRVLMSQEEFEQYVDENV